MKYFHKAWNKIKEIKWKLQYSDITYRTLLYLIKSASKSIDHFTNFMSYNNEFCLYLPLIINIQKDMSFRNRKILCTLHTVIFFQIEEATSLLKKRKKKKFELCAYMYLNKEDPIKIIVIVFVNCSLSTLIRTSVFFLITDYILKFR